MRAERRIGAKDSATRAKLLDAAEQLLTEQGYAAVTSRRVGATADIAPQLVHYYFRTMDDLFVEVLRRRSEAGLEAFARLIEDDDLTLGMLWEFQTGQPGGELTIELAALAHHRTAVRSEIAKYGDRFRQMHTEAVSRALQRCGISRDQYPPRVLTLVMTGVAQFLTLEEAVGMATGHEDTAAFIDELFARVERGGLSMLAEEAR